MTAILGAKCSDGIVVVADRKITRGKDAPLWDEKVFGDFAHIIDAYAGRRLTFDTFRKYVVGDSIVGQKSDYSDRQNFVQRLSVLVRRFNQVIAGDESAIEILVALHHENALYSIDREGRLTSSNYVSLGSGRETANLLLRHIAFEKITMRDFAKEAVFAIYYMEQYHPDLKVGVGKGNPTVKYLRLGSEWDTDAPTEDFRAFREYAQSKIARLRSLLSPDG